MRRLSTLVLSLLFFGTAFAQDVPRAAGPATVLVASDEVGFARPLWSPDGRRIAFAGGEGGGLWVARADGSEARPLSTEPGAGFRPAWSPDGSALLARTARYEQRRRLSAIHLFDLDAGTDRRLTPYRTAMRALPHWSADGAEALLLHADGLERLATGRPAVAGKTAQPVVLAEGRALARVTPSEVTTTAPPVADGPLLNVTPSPDGTHVAFEVLGGHLYVARADGSEAVDLGPGHRPTWSPDGRWVAFQRTDDDGHQVTTSDLWAARADGSTRVRLTDTPERLEMSPAWRPDGGALAFEAADEGALYLLPLAR